MKIGNKEAIYALEDLLDTTREYSHLEVIAMFCDAIDMTISALRKQDSIKPITERRNAGFEYRVNVCPTCGEVLSDCPKYCPECGQSPCWDGEEE